MSSGRVVIRAHNQPFVDRMGRRLHVRWANHNGRGSMRRLRRITVACAFSLAACSGSEPAAPAAINAVGTWSGTTGQGRSISFTVGSNGVSEIVVSWSLTGTSCSVNGTVTRTISPPAAVQNNSFSLQHDLGAQLGAVISMAGTFQSGSSSSGTLRVDDSVCNGTANTNWTAGK